MKVLALFAFTLLAIGCDVKDDAKPLEQPTLVGSWRFASYVVSDCSDPNDNLNDPCSTTASLCGVLTLTENTWTWMQTLPDGSQLTESGSFTLNTNYILLSGASAPGSKMYSISGSTFAYTTTSLTFTHTSDTNGCTYVFAFTRYRQPTSPFG